jgi:hypothetical protein
VNTINLRIRIGWHQSLTRWPEGDPTTTTQFLSRQIKTNNVITTIILTKMYQCDNDIYNQINPTM